MRKAAIGSLLRSLGFLQPAFTAPGFDNLLVIFIGWALTAGQHAVTETLVVTGVAGHRHHEAFHRFFSRGTWDPDRVGRLLFDQLLLRFLPVGQPIQALIDDTLAPKKGASVFGIASHINAVQSTKKRKVFSFGHCWVVLAIPVKLPFSKRAWALPVLFRLYRSSKECEKENDQHSKKTELAREMIDVLLGWTERRIDLSADVAYCCNTVTKGLPARLVLTGAMRPDAVLHGPLAKARSGRAGRPAKNGPLLDKPRDLYANDSVTWQQCEADLNGKSQQIHYKTMTGYWHRACPERLLRIVVVKVDDGIIKMRVFFSMDSTLSVPALLGLYSRRWSIEILFRDLMQLLGFADSSARKREAVLRVAPFVGFTYTILVLWCATNKSALRLAAPPCRPWYLHKHGLSFADVLRAARRAAGHEPIKRSPLSIANLCKPRHHQSSHQKSLPFVTRLSSHGARRSGPTASNQAA